MDARDAQIPEGAPAGDRAGRGVEDRARFAGGRPDLAREAFHLVEIALEVPVAERRAFLSREAERRTGSKGDDRLLRIASVLLRRCEEIESAAQSVEGGAVGPETAGEETVGEETVGGHPSRDRAKTGVEVDAGLARASDVADAPERTQGCATIALGPEALRLISEVAQLDVDAPPRLANGATVGRYTVRRFIAAGGMGEVYEALDERVQRRVALKVLPAFASSDRAQRFAREAMLMARVEHPSIARLYEWGAATVVAPGGSEVEPAAARAEGAPLHYIAMEFIDGSPLSEACARIRAGSPDDPRLLVELLLPIIDAVTHAHARGILHRDIKPGNILIESSGRARLLDFGVAALIEPDERLALTVTSEGTKPGTLASMSPEQVRGGSVRVTTQSDVYALGLVLAEALSGRPVVETEGKGIAEVVDQVISGEPPAISTRRGARSREPWPALDFIVRRALRKDPAARYASAAELAEDLRRVLRDEQPAGRALGFLEAMRDLATRHRRGLVVGGAAAVALAAVGVMASSQYVRAKEAEARSEVLVGQLLTGSQPLLTDLHRRLLKEGQPLAARRAAFEASVAYLEWVRERSPEDSRVLFEIARHYCELAIVVGGAGDASLGDVESARGAFARSREILDGLIAAGGVPEGESAWRRLRAQVLRSQGNFEKLDERAKYYRLATEDQQRAIELLAPGEARDQAERFFLITGVQSARAANDLEAMAAPLARLEELAREGRYAGNAEFWSELALSRRYHLDLLLLESRRDEALVAGRASAEAFARSMSLGLDEFTNNRHLARVELSLAALTAEQRGADASFALLVEALERSRRATLSKPGNSFARISFVEMLGHFAQAARDVATVRAGLGDAEGARMVVRRGLEAFDEGERFIRAFPLEGLPHAREEMVFEDVLAEREELRALGDVPSPPGRTIESATPK